MNQFGLSRSSVTCRKYKRMPPISKYIFLAIGGLFTLLFAASFLFELWKKIWIVSVGEVLEVQFPKLLSVNQRGLNLTVHYRFTFKGKTYADKETKTFDVDYHQEKEVLNEFRQQFPLGGKISIYHPQTVPQVSSITPGGAAVPKLISSFIVLVIYLIGIYIYSKGMSESMY